MNMLLVIGVLVAAYVATVGLLALLNLLIERASIGRDRDWRRR